MVFPKVLRHLYQLHTGGGFQELLRNLALGILQVLLSQQLLEKAIRNAEECGLFTFLWASRCS